MKVFLDTNVLLDVLGARKPHSERASLIWSGVERGAHEGYISAVSFNNVYYVMRRAAGRKVAYKAMTLLRDAFHIVPLDEQTIHRAIDADYPDFEDAIQFFSAVRAGADCIITRNVQDFPDETVPAITPKAFLANDSD